MAWFMGESIDPWHHPSAISHQPSALSHQPLAMFPRAVWLLGWWSSAPAAAPEAIYPLLPFFLTRVLGASPVSLGIVEGAAEAVNSGIKILSGRLADRAPSEG